MMDANDSVLKLRQQISQLTQLIADRDIDKSLESWLNETHGANSSTFQAIHTSCLNGVKEGWLCNREAGGIRFGRIFKPSDDLASFSVDVVEMQDVVGPNHSHPNGEIDMIMPLDSTAQFDGHGIGWLVYPAGSSHKPTVSNGKALVLYLLPDGSIKFHL